MGNKAEMDGKAAGEASEAVGKGKRGIVGEVRGAFIIFFRLLLTQQIFIFLIRNTPESQMIAS